VHVVFESNVFADAGEVAVVADVNGTLYRC